MKAAARKGKTDKKLKKSRKKQQQQLQKQHQQDPDVVELEAGVEENKGNEPSHSVSSLSQSRVARFGWRLSRSFSSEKGSSNQRTVSPSPPVSSSTSSSTSPSSPTSLPPLSPLKRYRPNLSAVDDPIAWWRYFCIRVIHEVCSNGTVLTPSQLSLMCTAENNRLFAASSPSNEKAATCHIVSPNTVQSKTEDLPESIIVPHEKYQNDAVNVFEENLAQSQSTGHGEQENDKMGIETEMCLMIKDSCDEPAKMEKNRFSREEEECIFHESGEKAYEEICQSTISKNQSEHENHSNSEEGNISNGSTENIEDENKQYCHLHNLKGQKEENNNHIEEVATLSTARAKLVDTNSNDDFKRAHSKHSINEVEHSCEVIAEKALSHQQLHDEKAQFTTTLSDIDESPFENSVRSPNQEEKYISNTPENANPSHECIENCVCPVKLSAPEDVPEDPVSLSARDIADDVVAYLVSKVASCEESQEPPSTDENDEDECVFQINSIFQNSIGEARKYAVDENMSFSGRNSIVLTSLVHSPGSFKTRSGSGINDNDNFFDDPFVETCADIDEESDSSAINSEESPVITKALFGSEPEAISSQADSRAIKDKSSQREACTIAERTECHEKVSCWGYELHDDDSDYYTSDDDEESDHDDEEDKDDGDDENDDSNDEDKEKDGNEKFSEQNCQQDVLSDNIAETSDHTVQRNSYYDASSDDDSDYNEEDDDNNDNDDDNDNDKDERRMSLSYSGSDKFSRRDFQQAILSDKMAETRDQVMRWKLHCDTSDEEDEDGDDGEDDNNGNHDEEENYDKDDSEDDNIDEKKDESRIFRSCSASENILTSGQEVQRKSGYNTSDDEKDEDSDDDEDDTSDNEVIDDDSEDDDGDNDDKSRISLSCSDSKKFSRDICQEAVLPDEKIAKTSGKVVQWKPHSLLDFESSDSESDEEQPDKTSAPSSGCKNPICLRLSGSHVSSVLITQFPSSSSTATIQPRAARRREHPSSKMYVYATSIN